MKRILGTLLLVIFLSPVNAFAHTALVSSSPKDRAVLGVSPTNISLTFNENLIKISGKNVSRLSLSDSTNKTIRLGKATLNKSKISAQVPSALSKGRYTITYRVVSADGHPVTGTIQFSLK